MVQERFRPNHAVTDEIKKRKEKLAIRRGYIYLLKNVAIMAVIILIAVTKVFCITTVSGTNMYPTILDGDILIGYRLTDNFVKNDVVIAKVDGKEVISRVIAKEGDSVDITEDGTLYVNGTEQTGEIAFVTDPGDNEFPYTVPEGCVYLLGDYRTDTYDSRDFGAVSTEDIKAKVVNLFRRRGI